MPRRRAVPAHVPAKTHNAILEAAYTRATTELEDRMTELLAPILVRYAKRAEKAFRDRVTDHLAAAAHRRADLDAILRTGLDPRDVPSLYPSLVAAAALDGVTRASTMICVKPRLEEAEVIADPGGAPPEYLHVTLAYLGEVEDDRDLDAVREALLPVAATHAPLAGRVGGYGEFRPPGCGILLPDVPGLVELRVAITEALVDAGVDYGRDHGFQAHITVDGRPEDGEIDEMLEQAAGEPLHFDSILVVRGDDVVYEIPLVGVLPVTASLAAAGSLGDVVDPSEIAFRAARVGVALDELKKAIAADDPVAIAAARSELNDAKQRLQDAIPSPPLWTAPAGDEVVDVAQLAQDIRAKTEPVRQALIQTTMTPALEQVGLSFDLTNPLTQKALASTGAKITGISETTRADAMKVIQSAWSSGLSIDHTAQMLSLVMQADALDRARTIARTELVGAVNGGSLAATQLVASATGSSYRKAWMTAPGARYPRHELYDGLDGQTVDLDQQFDVGGASLDHPGDPNGDPGEVINCRCTLRYVEGDDEEAATGGDVGAADDSEAAPATEEPQPLEEPPVTPPAVGGVDTGGEDDSYSADIGVTPFRSGEDEPIGFYESDKYGQFVNDVHDSAGSYGVTVDGLDRVTGVWEGDTEPSVSLRIHDGETGVRAYAANLGNAYNQDGVLIFGDHAAGDVMATFQSAYPQDVTTAAMAKAGLPGGRFTADGRLQVIGSGPDFVKQLDSMAGDLGPYDASVGRFELLERDSGDYQKAFSAYADTSKLDLGPAPLAGQDAESFLTRSQSAVATTLGDPEVAAVRSYVSGDYAGLNSALRTGGEMTVRQQQIVGDLDATIAKAPALSHDVTLWRGVTDSSTAFGTDDLESLVGKTITDPAFGSTTTAENVGVASARGGPVMKILAPAGTTGLWVPGLARGRDLGSDWATLEREFILPRGTTYEVVSVDGNVVTLRLVKGAAGGR